jgi:hypothetical protein
MTHRKGGCFHALIRIRPIPARSGKPYKYRCMRCNRFLKIMSGALITKLGEEPKVKAEAR